jgi:RNA polymerase sigma-70 factor (ECF subfamily)
MPAPEPWPGTIAAIYREDRRRVFASLVRLLGSFDLAEEALHDAFAAAVEQWPARGLPESPWRWLVSAGRFRTIDRLRRGARLAAATPGLTRQLEERAEDETMPEPETLADDTLRLIFTCCHPVLAPDAQVALTLREVCGLTTEEIARAFLTAPPTLAQRIVRAKARIREAAIPYAVPQGAELAERLEPVLRVIYLVFNEGYAASAGDRVARGDLTAEAIRLVRLVAALLPDPEVLGLLALMLFQNSRRAARTTGTGEIVLLPEQDRTLWDVAEIAEGLALLERLRAGREMGSYGLQAAIAAEHARAKTVDATDWRRVVELYELLRVADPSPIVELNRAAAIAMRDGPEAGLALMDALLADAALAGYQPGFAARAELHRRLGHVAAARADYFRALDLARLEPERRFLAARLAALDAAVTASPRAR